MGRRQCCVWASFQILSFLNYAAISKSLESVLSLGPRPTGGGSSPPELRHARAASQESPGLPIHPSFTAANSPHQPSQPVKEKPPCLKRESAQYHPKKAPKANKAILPSGDPLPDSELQRKIREVIGLASIKGLPYPLGQISVKLSPPGGAESAWSHPPGVPGSTQGHQGRCGRSHSEPQGKDSPFSCFSLSSSIPLVIASSCPCR